jgi:protein-tyrosine phosphatase
MPGHRTDYRAAVPSLADVVVERASGSLVVRWTWHDLAGRPPRVRVAMGDAPDAVDEVLGDVEGVSELRVAEPPPGSRRYFRVTTEAGDGMVVAERLVPLAGTLNFRDLGGYPAADGRRVRWGMLYRSDALATTTEADRDYLVALGVRVVHDFRYAAERASAPNLLPEGMVCHSWAIGGDAVERPDIVELMRTHGPEMFSIDAMIRMYHVMLADHATTFGSLFTHLVADDALPAIFHCTAGKDRTGIAAALLLSVLGVPDAIVLDDYELSTHYRLERRVAELHPKLEAVGVDLETVRHYLGAPREVLAAALAWIRAEHPTVEDYLTTRAGVARDVPDRLRALLLD